MGVISEFEMFSESSTEINGRFVSAGPDQRRTETSDSSGHVRGSYTYLDDKGVQHSVHYIAGPETGYRVLKNVKGPHLPTVFPFERPDIVPAAPDFYDYVGESDLFDTAASGHNKPGRGSNKEGNKPSFDGLGSDDSDTSNPKKPSGRPSSTSRPSYDDYGGDLFDGPSSTTLKPSSKPTSTPGSYQPGPRVDDGTYIPPGDVNQDDGQYRPGFDESGEDKPGIFGSKLGKPGTTTTRPSKPEDDGQYRPGLDNSGSGSYKPRTKPNKPNYQDYDDSNDLNLFGSESRPPFGGSGGRDGFAPPIIRVGGGKECDQCKGTLVTNVGEKVFSVPPGVSVRAHVQSIDLLPLASPIPSPSEQFNEDMKIKTEQLNSADGTTVINNGTTVRDDVTTTETTSDESIF